MPLELRLTNFFSIKDEITIDFRAANLQSKQARELTENVFDYDDIRVLKTMALYGANASGKSNIIKAIRFCILMITQSHAHNENTIFSFKPFKFDGFPEKPSSFFIRFVKDTIEFEYSFELTNHQIIKESLFYYPNGRITKIYERNESAGKNKKDIYSFGNQISRPLDVAESTSVKTLFLSRASQMDRELAKSIYNFIASNFVLDMVPPSPAGLQLHFELYKRELLEALQIADSDIIELKLRKEKLPAFNLHFNPLREHGILSGKSENIEEQLYISSFHRRNPEEPFDFFSEESAGTQRLLLLLLTIIDVTKNNKILVLDEIESNLHPQIVNLILKLFNKSRSAQLLYATHNTHLLSLNRLRKDQIIFCNKKEDGSTEVYSLYDFPEFRETMDLEKAYLQGRFDAVPYINDSSENLKLLYE